MTANLIEIFRTTLDRFDARALLDIGIVAFIIFWLLVLLRGTTAMSLLRGLLILYIAAFALGTVLNLTVLQWILRNSLAAMLVAIPVLFQPELRRALERLGRTRLSALRTADDGTILDVISEAAPKLADRHQGAIMVLERKTGLRDIIESGVRLDAVATPDILVSIFYPHSPLHDGAVIIRDGRIVAAKCILPLSDELRGPRPIGTRHRAAIGLTERTDAVSVVVSEETGGISVVSNGQLMPVGDGARLRRTLDDVIGRHTNGNGKNGHAP